MHIANNKGLTGKTWTIIIIAGIVLIGGGFAVSYFDIDLGGMLGSGGGNSGGGGGDSGGGIATFGIVPLVIIIAVVFMYMRHKKKAPDSEDRVSEGQSTGQTDTGGEEASEESEETTTDDGKPGTEVPEAHKWDPKLKKNLEELLKKADEEDDNAKRRKILLDIADKIEKTGDKDIAKQLIMDIKGTNKPAQITAANTAIKAVKISLRKKRTHDTANWTVIKIKRPKDKQVRCLKKVKKGLLGIKIETLDRKKYYDMVTKGEDTVLLRVSEKFKKMMRNKKQNESFPQIHILIGDTKNKRRQQPIDINIRHFKQLENLIEKGLDVTDDNNLYRGYEGGELALSFTDTVTLIPVKNDKDWINALKESVKGKMKKGGPGTVIMEITNEQTKKTMNTRKYIVISKDENNEAKREESKITNNEIVISTKNLWGLAIPKTPNEIRDSNSKDPWWIALPNIQEGDIITLTKGGLKIIKK